MTMTMTAGALLTSTERAAAGKSLRDVVPRSSHSAWIPAPDRLDPLTIIAQTAVGRIARLLPLRNARMAESPFAFFRGTAAIMAGDLAATPATGLRAQLSGDAHCLNFGAHATPERRLVFDVNDFDETVPGPWEWDVKRLAASLVLAARSIKLKDVSGNLAALSAVRAYRLKMIELAAATALQTWYARIDAADFAVPGDVDDRRKRKLIVDSANAHSMRAAVAKYTLTSPAGRRFIEDPPLLYHPTGSRDGEFDIERVFAGYPATLSPESRTLFGRYRLVDHAVKVVGVGSVGTRCAVALFTADIDDVLILQIKEAGRSVLEPHVGASAFASAGERVVAGQRMMQTASDVFLGWGTSGDHDFYVRQFHDKKGAIALPALDGYGLLEYARLCGSALAVAHARSGDAAQIGGYLGKGDTFDKAIVRFAVAYADQVQLDYGTFIAAVHTGQIPVA